MGETSLSTNEAFFLLLGLLIGISSMGGVLWYLLRERNRRIFELAEQVKLESQKNSEAMIEFQGLQSKHDAMLESIQGREQFTEKAMEELTNRFRNLSNTIYAEKSEEFKRKPYPWEVDQPKTEKPIDVIKKKQDVKSPV